MPESNPPRCCRGSSAGFDGNKITVYAYNFNQFHKYIKFSCIHIAAATTTTTFLNNEFQLQQQDKPIHRTPMSMCTCVRMDTGFPNVTE